MTKKRILILLITLLSLVNASYSQVLSAQEQAVEDNAFNNLSNKNFKKASEQFSQLLSIYRDSPVYNFYYGVCLVEQNQKIPEALRYIKYAEQNNLPQEDVSELDYYLGRVYHLTYDFNTALMYYKDFYNEMGEDAVKLYNIDREIRMAENGKELIQYISDLVVVENKRINQENYYYSYKLDDYGGKLIVKPDEYKTKLDKKNQHTQLMFLSDSGVLMYSSYGKKSKTLDIYQRKKDENGIWSEPELLPSIINTKYDDAFPYLRSDDLTLYFASKGHNSMGGYDILKSEYDTSKSQWTEPINMDFPINTPYDDYLYISDNNDEYAYFVSNRETADDKITIYKILIDKFPEKRQIENLDEIKAKSLLQISPLAIVDETKDKNSEYYQNQKNKDKENTEDNNITYNYERLSVSDILTNEEAIKVANEDAKKQEEELEKTKSNANNALLYSYTKHKEADELYKSANDLLSQNDISETDKQRAVNMQKEAKQNEEEAILAYNVYRNLTTDVSQKEKEANLTKEDLAKIQNNSSVDESVEIINKNREKNQVGKEKYFEINNEKKIRKDNLTEVKTKKEKFEPNITILKNDIDKNNNEIAVLIKEGKQTEAESIKEKNETLITQYKDELNKKEELAFKEQKLENEIEFLSNIESYRNSIGKTELAEKTKDINSVELLTKLDEKSLQIDVQNKTELNNSVEKQTAILTSEMDKAVNNNDLSVNSTEANIDNTNNNTETDNTETNIIENNTNDVTPTIIVTQKILKSDYKTEEGKFIVDEVNDNIKVVDSLNYTIAVKKQELSKETNPEKKQSIEKEISDLEYFVDLKTSKNDQLLAKANQLENAENNNIAKNTNENTNENNKNLEDLSAKNNEVNALYNSLNKNIVVVDSLTALSKEKQLEADKTEDINQKEVLINESDDLARLANVIETKNDKIQTQITEKESEIKDIALNANPNFIEEKQFPFENTNSSDKVLKYNKELFKQKFYQSKIKELEDKKHSFEQTKNNLTTTTAKQNVENQIRSINEEIKANANLAIVSKLKSEEIAKDITTDINTDISDEELYAEATSYNIKNTNSLTPKEKKEVDFTKEDKDYAEESYKNYKTLNNELEKLNTDFENSEGQEKDYLKNEVEIKNQEVNTQFNAYKNTIIEANYVEFNNLDKLISNYTSDKNNEKTDEANKLQNQARAYYIQANIIKSSAEKDDKKELEKAINFEKIAINKQKQALDIYLAENQTENNNQIANNSNSLTLGLDDVEAIENSNKIAYNSEKSINETEAELIYTENDLEKAKNIYGKKDEKNIQKLQAKKVELLNNKATLLTDFKQADSIKYNLYQDKINELNTNEEVSKENKINASQYINESEYFYSNAQILRTEAETESDIEKKIYKLDKAKQLEQTAIFNQETAFNILIDNSDNIFTSYGNLIKIDPLLEANKAVNTNDVKKATSKKIYDTLELNDEDIATLNKIPEKEEKLNQVDIEIEKFNLEKEELNKSIILTDDAKDKEKFQKKIQKIDDQIYALKFLKEVNSEGLNDSKYYILKNNLSNNKIRGSSEKARKANQLAKDADKYYNRAKTLRNKSEMVESTDQAYAYLIEANELELEGIDVMERAYTIFLDIQPEKIANNLADNNNSKDVNNVVEIKPADITEIKPDSTDYANNTKDIAINTEDTTTNVVNPDLLADNTNNVEVKIENVDENTDTITDNTEDVKIKTENTENTDNTVENNNTIKQIEVENNSNINFDKFSVYPISVYSNKKPIPVNPALPEGIIFKVQVGAFKNIVRNDAFNGLSPLAAEKIQGSSFTRYLVGQFATYEGGKLALNEVKTLGYKDAFVVAYKDGKRIPLYLARTEAKNNVSNYNDLAIEETAGIKNRNKNALTDTQISENANTNTDVADNNIVKADNIKSKNNLLYTVQIGVYRKAVSHSRLYNLNPIYEDVTQYGYIRYTTGIFKDLTTANTEKERIRQIGIKDAFVTAYFEGKRITVTEANKLKSENKATEETQNIQLPQVTSENKDKSTSVSDASKIRYKIQIGAYKSQVPLNEVKSFLSVARTKNLEQFVDDRGYTVFVIGNYNNYNEASNMKAILINEGITDAFIVAYNGNVKISVAKAKELLGK
jgi:hypothetical protein